MLGKRGVVEEMNWKKMKATTKLQLEADALGVLSRDKDRRGREKQNVHEVYLDLHGGD